MVIIVFKKKLTLQTFLEHVKCASCNNHMIQMFCKWLYHLYIISTYFHTKNTNNSKIYKIKDVKHVLKLIIENNRNGTCFD